MILCLGTKSDQGKTPQNLEENILSAQHFHPTLTIMLLLIVIEEKVL